MISYSVPDMSCGHCVKAISETIHALDPAASVSCDSANKQVNIESTVDENQLIQALSDAGYPPLL